MRSLLNTRKFKEELLSVETVTNDFNILTPFVRSNSYPEECAQHRRSCIINFSATGRKIRKGCCLGHSQNGCIAFSGIDMKTGQLLYITEWMIKSSQLEAKCAVECNRGNSDTTCGTHGVNEVVANIENQMKNLVKLKHINLVQYECVQCKIKPDGILVHLAQDFVVGNSVGNLSSTFGWCEQSASMITRSVVDVLIFLLKNRVSHGALYDSAVYIDKCSTIRVTDFGLVPYLQDLIGIHAIMKNDLDALGTLVESLIPTPSSGMRDFIEKCRSQDTLSPVELLDDPFLQYKIRNEVNPVADEEINNCNILMPKCADMTTPIASGSRFQCDYIALDYLGEGGFGDVFKAKNKLDNREYAIKRIRLNLKKRKLFEGMIREVKLLSRLNHENVVRYYTSWIESTAQLDDRSVKSKLESDDWSTSIDCVEFVNSSDDNDDDDCVDDLEVSVSECEDQTLQYMYIQMEYCRGNTLRTLIDKHLYVDTNRLWRLFREIMEGLDHIHQQNMIHRDLKPANIFISCSDRIKIGDFGLATTCRVAPENKEQCRLKSLIEVDISLTGNVGTALYSAPELIRKDYDQKVDIYSLGIILFEMSNAPFETGMERNSILCNLRCASVTMPEIFLNDIKYQPNVKVIQWLLNHEPIKRPTIGELLNSKLIPRAKVQINNFHEMVCDTIAQPQSNQYKKLVAQCLEQESEALLDLTYNHVPVHQNTIEYVKSKVVNLFRKHGAIEIVTPLLTPCSKNYVIESDTVRLMTHSGNNVFLPRDLRLPFARHIAINGINSIRRYSIERVYRKEKAFNFHPKQLHECAFDIVTPNPGNLLVDAELILTAFEITKELPTLRNKNISIRINHTTLLRAILMYFNIPPCKYDMVAANLHDYIDGKILKSQVKEILNDVVHNLKNCKSLLNMLTEEHLIGGDQSAIDGLNFQSLIKGRSEAASLAKAAIRDIELVVRLAQDLGVSCAINLLPGMPVGYERTKSGGIVWQMLAEDKFGRHHKRYILAAGERYDTFLSELKKSAHIEGIRLTEMEISAAGFSFYLENLMHAYATSSGARGGITDWTPVQVIVSVPGTRPPPKDVIDILKSLWSAGICSGFVESGALENACVTARKLGARHLVLLNETGDIKLRTFMTQNILQDRQITRAELINTILRMMEPDENNFRYFINTLKRKIYVLQREKSQLNRRLKKHRMTDRIRKPDVSRAMELLLYK